LPPFPSIASNVPIIHGQSCCLYVGGVGKVALANRDSMSSGTEKFLQHMWQFTRLFPECFSSMNMLYNRYELINQLTHQVIFCPFVTLTDNWRQNFFKFPQNAQIIIEELLCSFVKRKWVPTEIEDMFIKIFLKIQLPLLISH